MNINLAAVPILSIITFLPLAGALVIAFLPKSRLNLIRYTALGVALATWVASLVMLVGFQAPAPGEFALGETQSWIPMFGIQYKVGVDGLAVAMVVLTTTLTWISILASFGPIKDRVKEYMISFLILEVGMLGVFVALDLFLFYIFWEVVLVPMYLIIGIWGGAERIYATIKFVLYTLVGSLLMLVAILATAFTFHQAQVAAGMSDTQAWTGAFDLVKLAGAGFDPGFQNIAFGAFFLAFAIKVPMFPFHTWLPDAHVQAPTAGSVILAGVMLKLGAYGFIRFAIPLFPEGRAGVRAGDHRSLDHRHPLWRDRRARPAGPQEAGRLLIGQPHGLRDDGDLHQPDDPGWGGRSRGRPPGRDPPDGQSRPDHRRPLPPRRRHL